MRITKRQIQKMIREALDSRKPIPVTEEEYLLNKKKYDWVEKDELRAALGANFAFLKIVGPEHPMAVADFVYHPVGDKILPLLRGINGELFFKVNDSAKGTYYKV